MIIKSFCFVKAVLLLLTLTFLDFLSSYYHKGQRKSISFFNFFKKIILADFRLGCAVFQPDVQIAEIFFIFSLTLKVKRSNENQTFIKEKCARKTERTLIEDQSATATAVIVIACAITEAAAEEKDYNKDNNPGSSAATVVTTATHSRTSLRFSKPYYEKRGKVLHQITIPPLTEISCPVIYELPARNSAVFAIS